jgi:peptidoglycan-N-acetylglucosamine deacetylase
MEHLLTMDVEEWFRGVETETPPGRSLLVPALDRLLDALGPTGMHATFFVLGDDAAPLRSVLCRCIAEGHEVASHGMHHRRVDSMTQEEFRRDLAESIAAVENAVQKKCRGYRAPWFSAPRGGGWFFKTLAAAGLEYDASFRVALDAAPIASDTNVVEIPVPMAALGPMQVGVLGGLSLRALPVAMINSLFNRCEQARTPACVYLHPYEWHEMPCGAAPGLRRRIRRRFRVEQTIPRLLRLMQSLRFTSAARWIDGGRL